MPERLKFLPSMISVVGVDGSGKSTLSNWLAEELETRGRKPLVVWTRFRNYLSKPLLALTRLSGHNHYKTIDGVRFGFHDFEKLVGYREIFALLQAVDVNISALVHIKWKHKPSDILICERGPWDTLVDVTSDTGLDWLPASKLGQFYSLIMPNDASVLWISRNQLNILKTRPELVHDRKLPVRISIYKRLAENMGWHVIDNNGSLEAAKEKILTELRLTSLSSINPTANSCKGETYHT